MRRKLLCALSAVILACGEHVLDSGEHLDAQPSEAPYAFAPAYLSLAPDADGTILYSTEDTPYCQDFDSTETRLHYGKYKKQICDKRDGTKYVWVKIGTQDWLAENLRIARDERGNSIGRCYEDKPENCEIYGRLYTLAEAVCPEGWHIPRHPAELRVMLRYVDPQYQEGSELTGQGNNQSAIYLKTTSGWAKALGANPPPNPNGTDKFGFSALPGGYCGGGCPADNIERGLTDIGSFINLGAMSYWWSTAVGYPAPLAITWAMSGNYRVNDAMQSYPFSRFYARCIRD
jgi:uncharacterized protein (TIGR02145 family)